ncbi:MAG: monovalent cation/H(+) antiporter subunit G [Solirubrobacteraceae bacterium MAG38_C4-C5]|nr:monovalent cation/H(+) antiporter subunit G [Candidatus Siliceabacter maunaloa]
MDAVLSVAAGVLVVFGLLLLTISVLGIYRMPDVYTEVQATAKGAALGIVALVLAALLTGDGPVIARAVLIAAFLLITAPLAAHALVRAAYLSDEPMYRGDDEDGATEG